MDRKWESKGLHEHPAPHQVGRYGKVVLTSAGVYCLQIGGGYMSCPQDWAAGIHATETNSRNEKS